MPPPLGSAWLSARAALLHYGPKPAENGQFVLILGRLLAIDLPTDTEPHGTVGTLLFHCQTLRLFGTGFARSELEDCALNWAPRMGRPNCGSRSNTRSHFPSQFLLPAKHGRIAQRQDTRHLE